MRALRSVDDADVALLVIDATEGVTSQDQRLAERIDAAGCPVVVLLNKWDLLADAEAREAVTDQLAHRLHFIGDAPVLKISAQTGKGVHKLLPVLADAIERYHRRVPTRDVNQVLIAGAAGPARRRAASACCTACRARPTRPRSRCSRTGTCRPSTFATSSASSARRSTSGPSRSSSASADVRGSTWTISSSSRRGRWPGNLHKEAEKLARQHKLFVRDRIDLLCDKGSFVEDGLLANATAADLPADGVVTGVGRVEGRAVCVMANDPTVKAGSWGARTVEKIVRLTEYALRHELPVFWLIDSAGARITDQVELFPGRRGAGRIFANQVRLSGKVPQVCCLFGPSAAGGAYIPSFCDVVFMVEGNASMYLGSPRMAEEVIGERVTLEEMGGARMHATVSGAATTSPSTTPTPSSRPSSGSPTCRATGASCRRPPSASRPRSRCTATCCRRTRPPATTCTACSTGSSTPARSSRSSRCGRPR